MVSDLMDAVGCTDDVDNSNNVRVVNVGFLYTFVLRPKVLGNDDDATVARLHKSQGKQIVI